MSIITISTVIITVEYYELSEHTDFYIYKN